MEQTIINYKGAYEEDEGSVLKDVQCRDLSAWRVSIPRLEPRNDPNTGKACFVFIIQVCGPLALLVHKHILILLQNRFKELMSLLRRMEMIWLGWLKDR